MLKGQFIIESFGTMYRLDMGIWPTDAPTN